MEVKNIQMYVSMIATIIGIMFTVVVFLKKVVKNKKFQKVLQKIEEFTKKLIPCIKEAERYTNYTGEEKKEYVLTKIKQYAMENKIKYNEEEVTKKLEELIKLTKEVNVREKEETENKEEANKLQEAIRRIAEGGKK